MLSLASRNDIPAALILEDDFDLQPDFAQLPQEALLLNCKGFSRSCFRELGPY